MYCGHLITTVVHYTRTFPVNSKAVVADKNGDSDRDDVAADKNGDSDRDDGSDDSLSRGGIAGIVVAITVLSVVIVALIVVVYLVSKNRTSNAIR